MNEKRLPLPILDPVNEALGRPARHGDVRDRHLAGSEQSGVEREGTV